MQKGEDDQIDEVLADWAAERPDLDGGGMGIILRLQLLSKVFLEQVAEVLAELDLEWWEYDALSVLRRQGAPYCMAAMEIAEETRLSPGAMTNRIDRLQEKGLVKRIEDKSDRRRVIVQLSRKGRSLTDRAIEARFATADSALECLTGKQRQNLEAALRILVLNNDDSRIAAADDLAAK